MTSSQSDVAPARQRIAKLMARVGLCSRRDAETWIVDGRVSVNGEILTSPAIDVGPEDSILVDGAPLPAVEKTRLFLFHKPRGLVTSDRDPEGRATVADFLRKHWPNGPRVVTVGRLDINTEGLLLLTNDGGLARLLELPKTGWVRRYRVRAKGETDQSVLDSLRDGVSIDGIDYAGIEATLDRTQGANVWLTMGLREGKNREVKRVLEHIGLEVNRLIRLSFGPFQLGDLVEGAVEEVRTRVLRDQLGAALAAAAGVAFEDAMPPPASGPIRGDRKPGRTVGAERVNKGARPLASDGRDRPERGGDRPLRRPREADTPAPLRERPAAGPRKHVSTLRAEESETARRGPRRRIERGDVTDRRERSVRVERLVGVGARALTPTRTRGERPTRRDESRTEHRQVSPSALAKRARTVRSGGYGTERGKAAPRREHAEDSARAFGDKRPGRDAKKPRPASGGDPRGGNGGDRRFESKYRVSSEALQAARVGDEGAGHRMPRGVRDRPPSGARTESAKFGDDQKARGGDRRAGQLVDGDRSADARRRDQPQRDQSEGAARDTKRFGAKRPGPRSERAPRGAGQGADRRGDAGKRGGPRADGDRRKAPGGGRRPGGGKRPSRPGGGPGRGKPRPKA